MSYRIRLEKENFKFSCSHFTILGPNRAERLHGHNYYVSVELEIQGLDPGLGLAFDFNLVKPMIREATAALDEFVLLPADSPHLTITRLQNEGGTDQVRAVFGTKRYEFPADDVRVVAGAVNISSEELARLIASQLITKLRAEPEVRQRLVALSVGVQETRGQTVFFEVRA